MKRIRLFVAYDGTAYHGWQIQPNAVTIESELNRAISDLVGCETMVIGASRTDAGVHSKGNVAVFDSDTKIPAEKIAGAINARLPEDIRIVKSDEVDLDWHPRHKDCRKTYEYRITMGKVQLPTQRLYSHFTYHDIDIEAMKAACGAFIGEHDFASLCAAGSQAESTVRTIYALEVENSLNEVVIRVTGNGFLYNMVRIIAGTLLDVGMGRKKPEDIKAILESCDRRKAGPTLPAKGLMLIGYEYN
ncbi:MAG: tRNA pseudouridine(38-40) synthase TruA [Lachnospiraceae bacterium]|nr:tRNA pseudouridine(38-40) synthase TruA [Lachnospiraceae bacterium]